MAPSAILSDFVARTAFLFLFRRIGAPDRKLQMCSRAVVVGRHESRMRTDHRMIGEPTAPL
jgi:hypothetical protein